MVDIKVGGPAAAQGTDRKKAVRKPGDGGAFASLLDEVTEVAAAAPAGGIFGTSVFVPLEGEDGDAVAPRPAKRQAADLMAELSHLAEDVLAGAPSDAGRKLEAFLAAEVVDKDALPAEARQVLDEISTRAAVAVAKVKG